MSITTDSNAPRAGRREWVGVLALPCLLVAVDLTVLNLAVQRLSVELRPSSAQLLWIVDIYGFMIAGSLITMGTLGDRIGRRRLLLLGAAAFGVVSTLATRSINAEMRIVSRALLGIAGATLVVMAAVVLLALRESDTRAGPTDERVEPVVASVCARLGVIVTKR